MLSILQSIHDPMNPEYNPSIIPLILNRISDLENRLIVSESIINSLTLDVSKLLNTTKYQNGPSMYGFPQQAYYSQPPLEQEQQSIPLRLSTNPRFTKQKVDKYPKKEYKGKVSQRVPYHALHQASNQNGGDTNSNHLSKILKENEEVFIRLKLKDASESVTKLVFNGTDLVVNESDINPTLKGARSDKPGTLFYKVVNGLKASGQLENTFMGAPWSYCTVVREGATQSLDTL